MRRNNGLFPRARFRDSRLLVRVVSSPGLNAPSKLQLGWLNVTKTVDVSLVEGFRARRVSALAGTVVSHSRITDKLQPRPPSPSGIQNGAPISHTTLSSEPSCQHIEEYLETGRVRCRHDQIHAAAASCGVARGAAGACARTGAVITNSNSGEKIAILNSRALAKRAP
jgi:hypothetical protein